ncbi:tetratricopeptide repeat protein [Streptomyces sp. NPDC087440]|uniref:tetratricopeptide repeat protein n=1 Tax=Streptomyces sp. NPDC087440 TaxID=3365790 RepID=UPI0038280D22
MAERPLSRQELVRRRRRSGFVGRRAEMDAFRENLGRDPAADDFRFLFHVRGNAGVGKTSLLRQWEELAQSRGGAATAYVDDTVHSPVEAMEAVAERLGRQGAGFRRFSRQLETYRQRLHEAQGAANPPAGPEVPGPDGELAPPSPSSTVAAQVGLVGLGMVPGLGAFVGAVDPQQVAQGADRLRAALGSRLRSQDDVRLVLDPVRTLTPVFLEELAEAARKRPWVVLFFDVYERTGPALDAWLRDIAFDEVHGELPANVQLVLSGQGRLDARCWGDWLDLVAEVPLEVFTEEEARSLLALQGIADERVVEVVLRLSGGLPVLVHTLAQARPGSAEAVDDPSGTAVERFLKWENDPARRAAALACALPLQFDEDVFRAVVPAEAAEEYGWVRRLAFVTDRGGRCRYHEVVRTPMLRHQRTTSPARWREAHEALAELFRAGRERREEVLAEEEYGGDAQWRDQRAGETYHLLCADPRRALPDALVEVAEACEQGEGMLRRWVQLLARAGEDGGEEELAAWGRRLAGGDRAEVLDELLAGRGPTPGGRLRVHCVRGRLHARAERYEAALADFRAAVALDPESVDGWEGLARTLLDAGRAEESLAAWDEVVRVAPDRAEHHAFRGWMKLHAGLRDEALDDFDRAVALDPRQDWAFANRAYVMRELGRAEEGLADADRALAVDPSYPAAQMERARCLKDLDRWDEAEQAMRRAAELEEERAEDRQCRTYLAALLLDYGRYADALVEIDRALAPEEGELRATGWPYSLRAWALYGLGGREAEALAELDRSSEIGDWEVHTSAMRGWVAWHASELELAEREFTRVLAVEPNRAWCLGGRAVVRAYAGRHEDATADLTQAFVRHLGLPEAEAESAIARPVVDLLREHLPANRAAVTAAIRLVALYTDQVRWPGRAGHVASVLALRPSPRLVIGGVGVLHRAVAAVEAAQARGVPDEEGQGAVGPRQGVAWRRTWTLRAVGPLLRILERLPGGRG